jgi:hypothetical protein
MLETLREVVPEIKLNKESASTIDQNKALILACRRKSSEQF